MDEIDFGVLLGLAYHQFVAELHAHLAGAGFTGIRPTFGYAFRVLAREELTTSQLAARLQITPQGAAKTVEEMVAAGYVKRTPDPADGRVKRLNLTDRCRALMASAQEFHADFERRLEADLGKARVADLREVLTTIMERNESPDGLARALRQI
ncbi:MarR family winged helix-turn-helix transcriptional regulator [Nonomuraea lactucae]|uniref:MarR family winged helix-turn-helix transcriptional regulator n=1 Tax=Nonomuraea lactucae TaxID=2249762 RepID=UPI00196487FF|nr:MarR family winged helix-turn-helix transcriptional regulator [Nonomuraea lactucae]